MSPLVFINILTWNGEKWIEKCIDSILNSDYNNFKILVIDNHSNDRTCKIVKTFYPKTILIENNKNKGFAEGNNIGIRNALKFNPDFIVLLNQDIIVKPQWLRELVNVAQEFKEYGVLTPFQYEYYSNNPDPHFLKRMLSYNEEFRENYNAKKLKRIYEHSYSFGSAIFIKQEVFYKVGLFDPLYFAYHEEGDFFRRCIFHGYKMALVTSSEIKHWHTAIHPKSMSFKRKYLSYRNIFIAILKNPNEPFIQNMLDWVRTAIKMLLKELKNIRGLITMPMIFFIHFRIFILLPIIVRRRNIEKKDLAAFE